MSFYPTTTVRIDRDDSTAPDGDGLDARTLTEVGTGLPAAVTEDTETVFQPGDGRRGQLEVARLRVRGDVEVRARDYVTDEQTGRQYYVRTVNTPALLGARGAQRALMDVVDQTETVQP